MICVCVCVLCLKGLVKNRKGVGEKVIKWRRSIFSVIKIVESASAKELFSCSAPFLHISYMYLNLADSQVFFFSSVILQIVLFDLSLDLHY